jgi:hypothetical protein
MVVDRITAEDLIMAVIQARSQWRLAIGLTMFAALVITQAGRIMSGDQDIGDGGMGTEPGSTAITS